MRLIILLGCVVASASGCKSTKCHTQCAPCPKPAACPCPPGAPYAPAKPGSPTFLPPTIREVRGPAADEVSDSRLHSAAMNQDVLLIPRWVYVPYSPHMPTGPSKLPGSVAGCTSMGPYIQADERMTVLPAMGGSPMMAQTDTMEQCLQQMKMLNARISELEAKGAGQPATIAPVQMAARPQMLPLPPLPAIPLPPIPPAK